MCLCYIKTIQCTGGYLRTCRSEFKNPDFYVTYCMTWFCSQTHKDPQHRASKQNPQRFSSSHLQKLTCIHSIQDRTLIIRQINLLAPTRNISLPKSNSPTELTRTRTRAISPLQMSKNPNRCSYLLLLLNGYVYSNIMNINSFKLHILNKVQ